MRSVANSIVYSIHIIPITGYFMYLWIYYPALVCTSRVKRFLQSVCDSKTVTYKTLILLTTFRPNRTH